MTGPHHREHRLIAQEPDPCLGIGIHHHHAGVDLGRHGLGRIPQRSMGIYQGGQRSIRASMDNASNRSGAAVLRGDNASMGYG